MRLPALARRVLRDELARGSAINVVATGAQAVLAIAAAAVAARTLGPAGVGVVAIGLLLIEFVSVVDNFPSQGFVRDYAAEPTPAKLATVLVTKGALGLAATLVLLAAAPLVARAFDVPVTVPLLFALIPTTSIVSSVAIMAWEARRDMLRRTATPLAEAVVRLALYALVATAPVIPLGAVDAISVATVAASASASLAALFLVPSLAIGAFDARKAREYLSFGLRSQSTGVLQKIIFWFDIVLIDLVWGHATQGLYKTAYGLMAFLTLAGTSVVVMLYPTLARAFTLGDAGAVRAAMSRGSFLTVGVALPLALVLVAIPGLVLETIMGPEFLPAAWMLRALAFVGLLAVAILPFDAYFAAVNKPGLSLRLALLQVATNVVLNLVLVPRYGPAGAIAATGATFLVGLAAAIGLYRSLGAPFPRWRDVVTGGEPEPGPRAPE